MSALLFSSLLSSDFVKFSLLSLTFPSLILVNDFVTPAFGCAGIATKDHSYASVTPSKIPSQSFPL